MIAPGPPGHEEVQSANEELQKLSRFVESTRVKFRSRQTVDLEDYLRSIHPLDKAGGYSAQEDRGRLIECVEGSMSNVIGLPVDRVLAALDRHF
jgi:septum formation protein